MKLKRMITISIIVTALGLIIAAVGVAFFRHFSGLKTEKSFDAASLEREEFEKNIIKSNSIESALNSEIKNLTLLLHLEKELRPDDYVGEGFLIRMRSSQRLFHSEDSFEALFIINEAGNPNGLVWSLRGKTFTDYKSGIRTGYSRGTYQNSLKTIPLPISLLRSTKKPLYMVRDLDEWDIELFLPEEISKFTNKVQLVVNSGFQFKKYITVFEKEITKNDWLKTEYEINNNFKQDAMNLENKYVKNINGLENKWKIDIYKATIDTSANAIPDTREEF